MAVSYSESLRQRRLDALAHQIWVAALDDSYPKELKVRVALGFYLPKHQRVLDELAPMVLCPPLTRKQLFLTLVHEFCRHRIGYSRGFVQSPLSRSR